MISCVWDMFRINPESNESRIDFMGQNNIVFLVTVIIYWVAFTYPPTYTFMAKVLERQSSGLYLKEYNFLFATPNRDVF